MKKYTIKEFAEGKKAVKIENREQWDKLDKVHRLTTSYYGAKSYSNIREHGDADCYESRSYEVLEFSQLDFEDEFVVGSWYKITKEGANTKYIKYLKTNPSGYFQCSEHINSKYQSYGGTFGIDEVKYLTKASLEEIQQYLPKGHVDLIKKDTFVLPEFWYVRITEENKEVLSRWRFNDQPRLNLDSYIGGIVGLLSKYPNSRNHNTSKDKDWNRSIEITFEQFQQFVLKNQKEKNMEKEIVGYKLKFDEYKKATLKICNTVANWENSLMGYDISVKQTRYVNELKEAGVLDLWFEPVFKEQFKKDDYVTVVSIGTYDYDSSCGDTKPIIGKTYKIYNVSTNYVNLDVPNGIIAIKSFDLRKATEDEIKSQLIDVFMSL